MLQEIIYKKLKQEEVDWLHKNTQLILDDETGNKFVLTYSLIFRFISNDEISWEAEELAYLEEIYPYFDKNLWNKHSLCRVLIMTQLSLSNNKAILQKLLESATFKEQVDLYKSLFFLDNAKDLVYLIEDGIRTNATDVLEAIALNNPFGAKFLTDDAWNQLVLKAIFTERPLYKIYGLNDRKNEKLALILNDFIHERWSANRTISPEVWQLIEGFPHPTILATAKEAASKANNLELKAINRITNNTSLTSSENKMFWEQIGQEFNT